MMAADSTDGRQDAARSRMAVGERLRELRSAKQLYVREVAKSLKRNAQSLYRWEWGVVEPSLTDLRALAKFYECTVAYLVSGEGDPPGYVVAFRQQTVREGDT